MGNKPQSGDDAGSLNPFLLAAEDNKDGYEFPDGTKSRFKYEEKPRLKTIEGESKVDDM